MTEIVCLDIETSPNLGYVWQLWNTTMRPQAVVEPSDILGLAYTNVDLNAGHMTRKRDVRWVSQWDSGGYDGMIDEAWNVLERADILLTKNGKRFDVPRLRTALALAGKLPPRPFRQIDLEEVCKRTFNFPSHSLDYVCKQFGLGGKKGNEAGFKLWLDCLRGDEQSQARMGAYCINDVMLTVELYRRVRPWIERHPNITMESNRCPKCGGDRLARDGFAYTNVSIYQRYKCISCGNRAIRGTARLNKGGVGITEAGT